MLGGITLFKKTKTPVVAGGKIDNILGPNTSYNGTVKSDGNIRIDGIYQGYIETAGNLIIGPSAKVLADIVANSIQVWGAVRGNITAQSRLEILPDGRVWGDIHVASLLIDEGGMFRGQCVMASENAEPLTLLESGLAAPMPAEEAPANDVEGVVVDVTGPDAGAEPTSDEAADANTGTTPEQWPRADEPGQETPPPTNSTRRRSRSRSAGQA